MYLKLRVTAAANTKLQYGIDGVTAIAGVAPRPLAGHCVSGLLEHKASCVRNRCSAVGQ